MLNLKNIFDEIFKKAKIKIKFQKMKGTFFGQHPLVEKSPTATDIYIYQWRGVHGCCECGASLNLKMPRLFHTVCYLNLVEIYFALL